MKRPLPILLPALLATACSLAPDWDAPEDRWTLDLGVGGGTALDTNPGTADNDVDLLGGGLTYEGFAFERWNLAFSVLFRSYDGTAKADFDSWIARAQIRWHDEFFGGVAGYVGLGVGGAFDTSSPGGTDYSADAYGDLEAGLRWPLGEQWGLSAFANGSVIQAEDDASSAREIQDPVTLLIGAGIWVDF